MGLSNTLKRKTVCVVGIIAGIVIMIVGASAGDPHYQGVGKDIKFGADFYTEMYDVTADVGRILQNTINEVKAAIGVLIMSIGAFDICYFAYKLVNVDSRSDMSSVQNTKTIAKSIAETSSHKRRSATNDSKADGDGYVDVECPNCGEALSFLCDGEAAMKADGDGYVDVECPNCGGALSFLCNETPDNSDQI